MTSKSAPDGGTDLSTGELFDVLADGVRRTVLFHLRQHDAATVDDLTTVVGEAVAADDPPEDVHVWLDHVHLPALASAGLVEVDRETGTVTAVPLPADLEEWLDRTVRREVRVGTVTSADTATADAAPEPLRVLLVDDEPGLAEAIATAVERDHPDVSVDVATDVPEAVATLADADYDCIVSDYQMPALSGLDFLLAVREDNPRLPFIVFTARGSEETASRAIESGVTDYVRKATVTDDYDVLVDRIRRAVDRS